MSSFVESDKNETKETFPPPPAWYKLYSQANPPLPPPVPEGSYSSFGNTYSVCLFMFE
jgi:hypothetical protein